LLFWFVFGFPVFLGFGNGVVALSMASGSGRTQEPLVEEILWLGYARSLPSDIMCSPPSTTFQSEEEDDGQAGARIWELCSCN
jgi:hypothetical protein